MTEIDSNKWQEFVVGDLFNIHPTKAYKLINTQIFDGGETPVVANSAYNNGIGGYTTLEPTEKGNMITFSDTVNANTIFYQPQPFVGYPHVQGLYPIGEYADKWNKYSYLFFVSVFRTAALARGFDYANKFRRDIASQLIVKLPVTQEGKLDWDYMNVFMKQKLIESQNNLEILGQIKCDKAKLDLSTWKEFLIDDLFEIIKPPVLHTRQVIEDDNGIPYVVRTKFNNGIKFRVAKSDDMNPSPAGVITFGAENATFFYQKEEFVSGRDIYYLDTQQLSKGTCLFLTACLQTITSKYSYSYGLFPKSLRNEIIKLPVTQEGTPDWNFMDGYMQDIMRISRKEVVALLTVTNKK